MKSDWERARAQVPYIDHDTWPDLLEQHPEVLHRIIADAYDATLREEQRASGEARRSGRRPKPPQVPLEEVYGKVFPQQYAVVPFREALAQLMEGQSQRQFARKVPCNQATLSKLLSGAYQPDLQMLERLAIAGGQGPWYFIEWRAGYVGELVARALEASPSTGVQAVRALRLLSRRAG